jgi:DNA-binding transcriptional LysR family regulator
MNSSLVKMWAPRITRLLANHMPNLVVGYEVDISYRLIDRIMAGRLDVGFMHAPTDIVGIRRRKLYDLQCIWIARPDVIPARKMSVRELAQQLIVMYGDRPETYNQIEAALRSVDAWPLPHLTSSYSELITTIVRTFPAVGTILRDSVRPELDSGEFIEIDCDVSLAPYEVHACYSLTASSRLTKKLVDLAAEFCLKDEAEGH